MLIGDEECAASVVKEIYEKIRRYNENSGNLFAIGMSFGSQVVSCMDGLSVAKELDRADKRMYEQKKQKRKNR